MSALVVRGDARRLPLPAGSVDLVVTSPPYFALRSYTDGGEHYAGQVGSEATPAEFVAALLEVTAECVRVLKPGGSIFVNLGDKYSRRVATRHSSHQDGLFPDRPELVKDWKRDRALGLARMPSQNLVRTSTGELKPIREKSLMGLPWRYAIGCIDQLGLILRAEVIWSKCISGGTGVYARVNGREKVILAKDLGRCRPGTVELWTGEKWSPMLRCEQTPPTAGRAASSAAARSARYRGKAPVLAADLEIEFRNGDRIGCTPNHKWPTERGVVRADELTIGDVVAATRLPSGTTVPVGLDDQRTGWLVGLYIAEGSRSEDMVQIASHVREEERFTRLQAIADAFDGRFALHQTKGNAATANLSGKILRAILDTYVGGRTAVDKRLAPACWRRSDEFLRALMDGYLSGDGGYDRKLDRWTLGFCANDGLASDLRTLGARLGYSVRLRRTVHHYDGRGFPGWGGTLYVDPSRRKRPDSEVVAIRQSRARQFWNIEIADDPHQFALASGILTCNSNGLPESVTDRVRRSHETWFHFVAQPRYYAAVDEVREPATWTPSAGYNGHARSDRGGGPEHTFSSLGNPLGALPGSVQTVATEPLSVPAHLSDHFAAFPSWWPWWIIKGWSPAGICVECGEGRRPVVVGGRTGDGSKPEKAAQRVSSFDWAAWQEREPTQLTGYACACPTPAAPTVPAVILDPFGGTGTTALMADALGRHAITVDLSADYCALADWRIFESGQGPRLLAKHEGRTAPRVEVPGQATLFG